MNKILLTLITLLCFSFQLDAKDYLVSLEEVRQILREAKPGDEIIIKNGLYKDLELKWYGEGEKENPIIIRAEKAGEVVITGSSALRFAGEYLEISGLNFRDGAAPKGAVVEMRYNKDVANNCQFTNCVIDGYNPLRRDMANSYLLVYGRNNRVDHNSFLNKLNLGVTLIVMINEERSQKNFHQIDNNYFGPRPVYGSNGAETVRVGTSQQAYKSSNTLIENNIFDRCNGEVECVSIKSSDNIIKNNYFYETEGVLALRHGDRNLVEENIFVGNGKRNTGGIRVVNAAHIVKNNLLIDIAGERFFSALALMNAVPNSLPNRYCLVEDVKVLGNTFINCTNIEFGTGKDLERTLAPERILFEGNLIFNKELKEPFIAIDQINGFEFDDNIVSLAERCKVKGFKNGKIEIPQIPTIEQVKEGKGADWYKEEYPLMNMALITYIVKPGDDLPKIVADAKAGSIIELTQPAGDYSIDRELLISKPLTIIGKIVDGKRPVIRFNGEKKANMITIADGGSLTISGVSFSGELEPGKALAAAGISTANDMIKQYELVVDNCEFYDFGEGGFFAIKGTKGTMATRVEIKNTLFRALSGDAINYAAEKDDKGRYNAEDMLIENCSFHRILGLPINILRGGSDESTAGPYVTIKNCNFEDCCNKERGSVMRLIGPQVLDITSCNFSNSGRGGKSIRLDEATWEKVTVSNCNFWNSGAILTMTEKVVKGDMYKIKPEYTDENGFDFSQQATELKKMKIGLIK